MRTIEITTTQYNRSDVVKMVGRVDHVTSEGLEQVLQDLLDGHRANIVFDMSEVNFLSSKGLRILTEAQIRAKKVHGKVVLSEVNEKIRESLKWVGLDKFFEIYNDLTEAVGSF